MNKKGADQTLVLVMTIILVVITMLIILALVSGQGSKATDLVKSIFSP